MPKLTIEAGPDTYNTRILLDDEPIGVVQHITFQASANALMPACTIVLYKTADNAATFEKLRTIPWLTILTTSIG